MRQHKVHFNSLSVILNFTSSHFRKNCTIGNFDGKWDAIKVGKKHIWCHLNDHNDQTCSFILEISLIRAHNKAVLASSISHGFTIDILNGKREIFFKKELTSAAEFHEQKVVRAFNKLVHPILSSSSLDAPGKKSGGD